MQVLPDQSTSSIIINSSSITEGLNDQNFYKLLGELDQSKKEAEKLLVQNKVLNKQVLKLKEEKSQLQNCFKQCLTSSETSAGQQSTKVKQVFLMIENQGLNSLLEDREKDYQVKLGFVKEELLQKESEKQEVLRKMQKQKETQIKERASYAILIEEKTTKIDFLSEHLAKILHLLEKESDNKTVSSILAKIAQIDQESNRIKQLKDKPQNEREAIRNPKAMIQ